MFTSFPVAGEVFLQHIGEEEKPEDGKHDKKLDQDDDPQLFTQRPHVPEALVVEVPHAFEMVHVMPG